MNNVEVATVLFLLIFRKKWEIGFSFTNNVGTHLDCCATAMNQCQVEACF